MYGIRQCHTPCDWETSVFAALRVLSAFYLLARLCGLLIPASEWHQGGPPSTVWGRWDSGPLGWTCPAHGVPVHGALAPLPRQPSLLMGGVAGLRHAARPQTKCTYRCFLSSTLGHCSQLQPCPAAQQAAVALRASPCSLFAADAAGRGSKRDP